MTSIRQDNMIRQRHLRDRFVTAQSMSHAVIGNRGRPIHRDTVINLGVNAGFTAVVEFDIRLLSDVSVTNDNAGV